MAKQAKAKKAVEKKVGDSKRAGYKRGSNSRINQTVEKIMRRARAVFFEMMLLVLVSRKHKLRTPSGVLFYFPKIA
ncbi:hypothetical protein LSG11_000232 [Shigella flexneri]|nr:hypothetical protein [Shigella flexneri]